MATTDRNSKVVAEFGDFQTPHSLALNAVKVLHRLGLRPRCIVEPTCGTGAFLVASAAVFQEAERLIGVDINPSHLKEARTKTVSLVDAERICLREGDFFKLDWGQLLSGCPRPLLILGNPPWVTISELGALKGVNLPEKSNFHGRTGIEAITGKSNFDISEWMLLRYLDWLRCHSGAVAVLCKTSVARKILIQAWKHAYPVKSATIYKIDAQRHFSASVDACFFVIETEPGATATCCDVFENFEDARPSHTIGLYGGILVSDFAAFSRRQALLGTEDRYIWRSGIKHDCSRVMELTPASDGYRNGFDEVVCIEDAYLYPMFKSSDIAKGRRSRRNFMLVTQTYVGEDTSRIAQVAPRTWRYLEKHATILNERSSSIYRDKPPFSIFGVGAYTFAPWKVAVSGFYKRLHFECFGPVDGRPVVFDDTIYFLPCRSEAEARFIEVLLNSPPALEFYESMMFMGDKRPVTGELLRRLSFKQLAELLGKAPEYDLVTQGIEEWPHRYGGRIRQGTQRRLPL